MRTKKYLATVCLCAVLGIQALSAGNSAAQAGECKTGAFRGWLKACLTVKCKTPPWCANPPAAADAAPAPADAPKTDAAPAAPAAAPAAPAAPTPPAAAPRRRHRQPHQRQRLNGNGIGCVEHGTINRCVARSV